MDNAITQKLMNLIKERRSVRIFNGKKIAREDVLSIIEAATWAPTGCNNQELKFLVLDKEELKEVLKFKSFFRGVSTVILVFCDMSLPMSYRMYREYKHERHLPYVDTGLALANMILYAKSKGIDSCIFNLSKYHAKRREKDSRIKWYMRRLKRKLGLYYLIDNSFEFYLRKQLKMPKHLEIMCGVALGFAAKQPDVRTAKHGGRKIMREDIDYYILSK
jgi:hypothetical protein